METYAHTTRIISLNNWNPSDSFRYKSDKS